MSAAATGEKKTSATASGAFVRVPSAILRCLETAPVNLYLPHESAGKFILFREAGYELGAARAAELSRQCGELLHVRTSDYKSVSQMLASSLDRVIADETLSAGECFGVLQTAAAIEIEESIRRVHCDGFVTASFRIGRQITSLIQRDNLLAGELFGIVRHDFATFVHVTNVSGYATLLAHELGITERQELEQVSIGGLLHDIGKRLIPSNILSKPGKLEPSEREIVNAHPLLGYEELVGRDDLNFGQLMMVYQHHEHIDGKGYPVGILGDEIHPWAKMLAVVDVFDALTGKRPYRTAASKDEALQFLRSRAGRQFDEEMVTCWESLMQKV